MAGGADTRPLSPHLGQWRWHITMLVSILHRVTGVALYLGAIGLVVWLCALAAGPDAYGALMGLVPAWLIWTKLYVVTAALGFHAANGVRHLFWDMGKGFQPKTADLTAWLVILFALAAPCGLYALTHL